MKKIFTIAIIALSINAFAQIPTNGLVAHYPFNGNANDASVNGNNGTVNGAILCADRFGNANSAYSFDGVNNNSITVPNSSSLNLTSNEISISMWIKWQNNDDDNNYRGLSKGGMDVGSGYELLVRGGSDTGIVEFNISPNTQYTVQNANSLRTQWVHLLSVFNNGIGKIYVNGVLSSIDTSSYTNILSNTEPLYLGPRNPNNNYAGQLNGLLDDIRIYNRALNAAEISSLYNEGLCYQTITVTDTLIINANITGFSPITYKNTIKVFPNPTNDQITIDFGSNFSTMNGYTLKITNSLSQVVYTTSVNQPQKTVDLSTWTGNGIYFVHLIDAQSNTIDIRKIVLQ